MKKYHSGESYGEHSFKSSITVKGRKYTVLPRGTFIYQQADNTRLVLEESVRVSVAPEPPDTSPENEYG